MRALILLLALSGCDDDPPNAPMEAGSVNQYRDEAHRVTCYTAGIYVRGRAISCVADPTPCPVCADGGAR